MATDPPAKPKPTGPKFFDIAHPGKTAPNATSRPILPGLASNQPDPMVKHETPEEFKVSLPGQAPVGPEAEAAPAAPSTEWEEVATAPSSQHIDTTSTAPELPHRAGAKAGTLHHSSVKKPAPVATASPASVPSQASAPLDPAEAPLYPPVLPDSASSAVTVHTHRRHGAGYWLYVVILAVLALALVAFDAYLFLGTSQPQTPGYQKLLNMVQL